MTDLLLLAERVEGAEAGSFDLDKAILAALGYTWRGMAYWSQDDSHVWPGSSVAMTRSLDAALTLVPEGWTRLLDNTDGKEIAELFRDGEFIPRGSHPSSPALALTAACLRARHSMEGLS